VESGHRLGHVRSGVEEAGHAEFVEQRCWLEAFGDEVDGGIPGEDVGRRGVARPDVLQHPPRIVRVSHLGERREAPRLQVRDAIEGHEALLARSTDVVVDEAREVAVPVEKHVRVHIVELVLGAATRCEVAPRWSLRS
jgi:hypothetical protein